MSVAEYLDKHFYDWANIVLISKNDVEQILYQGEVGKCNVYLTNQVNPKPINFLKDETTIEVVL